MLSFLRPDSCAGHRQHLLPLTFAASCCVTRRAPTAQPGPTFVISKPLASSTRRASVLEPLDPYPFTLSFRKVRQRGRERRGAV